ncbi:MAG: HEAT repeat domain-containing protein [Phycisphaeraceae bacterium]|nr:HEAT repeat domain-containing protein [Phycisphaeraceae bacterium]
MPRDDAVAKLAEVLAADECPVVRHEAAFCLGTFRNELALVALSKSALSDSDELVRHEASEALGDMGLEAARETLELVRMDSCESVRRTAVMALQELDMRCIQQSSEVMKAARIEPPPVNNEGDPGRFAGAS